MAKHGSVLDGPRMGYGPVQQQRRAGVPLSTVILAIVCVVLAGLLALSLAGRHQAANVAGSTSSASPMLSGTDAPPTGANDAVVTFVNAWALPPADRDDSLASVTVTDVPGTIDDATAAKLAKTQPAGAPAYTRLTSQSYRADQHLADGTAVHLQLIFDQAAVYGWLISSVQLG